MSSDSESDTENREKLFEGVSARILLIDVSKGGTDETQVAFETCFALLRHVTLNSSSNIVGVILYGTLQNDGRGFENVIKLIDLNQPTVDDILKLKKLVSNIKDVEKYWGTTKTFNFTNALWLASHMFSNCKKKMSQKSIIVLSHFSEPNKMHHRSILTKASDLFDFGIDISLINVSYNELPKNSFYAQLQCLASKQSKDEWEPPAPLMSVDTILPVIWQNTHRKSASSRFHMMLNSNIKFGVALYHLYKAKPFPKIVLLNRESNKLVESSGIIHKITDENIQPLLHQICRIQNYGERNIELNYGEYMQLRKFGGMPSIKLLGFKSSTVLEMSKWYLKSSAFLYPDEHSVSGSIKLFRCLRDRCLAKDCIAICLMVPRWYTHPRLVALVPQKQVKINNRQVQPDGFHVIYIPYADNIRDVPMNDEQVNISNEQLECFRKLIRKLRFKYSTDSYDNPRLQTLYSAIEALALDDQESNKPDDTTVPDSEMQRKRTVHLLDDFNNLFGPFGTASKRKTEEETLKNKKNIKEQNETPDLSILASRIANKTIEKYTVPQLKQIIKWRMHSKTPALTGLKKERLVQCVYEFCSDIN